MKQARFVARGNRVPVLDSLRGIASLAVCWFHLTNGNRQFLSEGPLKLSGAYGWLGVDVFFVISGFVIPYALYKSDYKLTDYPRFLIKRIIRLDPPYLAAVGIIILLNYLSTLLPFYKGHGFNVTLTQVLLHLGYLNAFFGFPWLNIVFWTLAIEFQYYLLIGLIYPSIISKHWSLIALIILGVLSFKITSGAFIFRYIFLFFMGIAAFQYKMGILSRGRYILTIVSVTAGSYATLGALETVAGLFSAYLITAFNFGGEYFNFLAKVSYSLYLLHAPVGGRIINLGQRFAQTDLEKILILIVAFGACILASYVLYRFVEKPAQELSNSIGYNAKPKCHHQ